MNKELFCTYQQSLYLKELGFNEDCISNFVLRDELPAPLKSQAFKFFREKYGLHSVVNRYPSGAFSYVIDWFAKDKDSHEKESWGDKSYDFDIAESFCIDTLIKLAKQINQGSFKVECPFDNN